jgi:nucleotide-sensitive chloride channel 1A
MFKAMNECQLLHPDPDDSVEEEDDDDDDDEDQGESVEYNVAHAEEILGVETANNGRSSREDEEPMDYAPGQFDDAD